MKGSRIVYRVEHPETRRGPYNVCRLYLVEDDEKVNFMYSLRDAHQNDGNRPGIGRCLRDKMTEFYQFDSYRFGCPSYELLLFWFDGIAYCYDQEEEVNILTRLHDLGYVCAIYRTPTIDNCKRQIYFEDDFQCAFLSSYGKLWHSLPLV